MCPLTKYDGNHRTGRNTTQYARNWLATTNSTHVMNESSLALQLIVQILHQRGHFDSKFQVEGVVPHESFLHR